MDSSLVLRVLFLVLVALVILERICGSGDCMLEVCRAVSLEVEVMLYARCSTTVEIDEDTIN